MQREIDLRLTLKQTSARSKGTTMVDRWIIFGEDNKITPRTTTESPRFALGLRESRACEAYFTTAANPTLVVFRGLMNE